jgi:hypothetical protein
VVTRAAWLVVSAWCLSGCSLWVAERTRACAASSDCAVTEACELLPNEAHGYCVPAKEGFDAGPTSNDPDCSDAYGIDGPHALRIGAVLTKTTATGGVDQRGVYRRHAISLAVDQLNQLTNRTADDPTVFVRVCDDFGLADTSALKARALMDDGYVALLTGGSSSTLAAANEAVPRRVVVLSVSGSSSQIGSAGVVADGGKLVWSAGISDQTQARVLTSLAPPGSLGAIGRDTPGFVTLHQLLNDAWRDTVDGGFVSLYRYPSASGPRGAVAQMLDAGVPTTVVPLMPVGDSKLLFDAFTEAGVSDPVWLFTDNSRNTQLFDEALPDGGRDVRLARLAGARGTGPSVDARSSAYLVFQARYASTFGVDPLGASYVPNTYDAVLLLAGAALWSRVSPEPGSLPLVRGLMALSDPAGAAVLLDANEFPTTLRSAFLQGRGVNVRGASGELDFDALTGTAPSPLEEWVLDADAGFVSVRIWTELADGGLQSRPAQ